MSFSRALRVVGPWAWWVGVAILVLDGIEPLPHWVVGVLGALVGVGGIARLLLGTGRRLAHEEFEGSVWEREHAPRGSRRP